jgi:uroporphyrinogen decarboxylase
MASMTKRERVMAALKGDDVDRVPVSFWGHDFLREWSPEDLAAVMLEPVRAFDYDYLKVNPRATYYAEAWGCRYRPSNDPMRGPQTESYVLQDVSDLEKVGTVSVDDDPFPEQLASLSIIANELNGEVPFVQTVFSPLSVLGRLADGNRSLVKQWMADEPELVHGALACITHALGAYAHACIEAGADGIFFPTTEWGTYDNATADEYIEFGRQYDLLVLQAVSGAPFNMLHVCRAHNMLDILMDYPVPAINWAVQGEGNASLADAKAKTQKAVMGGMDERGTLVNGSPDDVRSQVRDALEQTGGRGFLLAPGCSIPPNTPKENLRAAVEAVRAA